MAMSLFAGQDTGWMPQAVLFDMTSDTVKAKLPGKMQAGLFRIFNPQWTADGRYFYHIIMKTIDRPGQRTQYKVLSRIWDAKAGKEVGLLTGLSPIGAGPNCTMVLVEPPSYRKKFLPNQPKSKTDSQIVLHAQDDKTLGKTLHPLGDMSTYPISTQGKWLLYMRTDAEGKKAVCMAEIILPKK
jgi:hypothetical protein